MDKKNRILCWKRSIKGIGGVLLFLFVSGCVSAGLLEGERAYFEQKNLNNAAINYKNCLDEEGESGENACHCAFMLGNALYDQKKFAEAIPFYKLANDRASEAKCNTYSLRTAWNFWLGRAYFENRQYREAVVYFAQAVSRAVQNPATLMPVEAIYWRKNYLPLIPPKSGCYFWLGNAYYFSAQYQEAVGALKKAIELDPTSIDFYTTLAGAYRELKQYDEAIAAVKRSIEIKPSDYAYGVLATIYEKRKDYDQAVTARKKAIEFNPNKAGHYFNLAQTYNTEEKYNEAVNSYQKGLALNPDEINGLFPLATTYLAMGKFGETINTLKRVLSLMTTTGIGIQISIEGDFPVIKAVAASGPAQRTDLRVGDRITKIDGKTIQGLTLDKAVEKMKGKEGTPVVLTISRKGSDKSIEKTLIREKVLFKGAAAPLAVKSFAERALGNAVSAYDDAAKAYSLDPEDPWGWSKSAMSAAYVDKGRYTEALAILSKSKDSRFDRLLESLAYARQKDLKKALDLYSAIPEDYLSANQAHLKFYKSMLLESLKPYGEIQMESAKTLEKKVQYREAMTAYAEALKIVDEGTAKEIRSRVAVLLKNQPYLTELNEEARKFALRGEVLLKEGNLEASLKEFGKALRIEPFNPKLNFNMALVYGELKSYNKAIRFMNNYLELLPDAPNARQVKDEIYKWQFKMERGDQ